MPAEVAFELPPLPTLAPLPTVKPLAPMPLPSWDSDAVAPTVPLVPLVPLVPTVPQVRATPPPPPAGHPAAHSPGYASPPPASVATSEPTYDAVPSYTYTPFGDVSEPGLGASTTHRFDPVGAAGAWPSEPVTHEQRMPEPAVPEPVTTPTAPAGGTGDYFPVGRHAGVEPAIRDESFPLAPGLRVLVIGGSEPLGGMVAERLIRAGHRLAVHGVSIPSEIDFALLGSAATFRMAEPLSLSGDRADAEDMVHSVARAEVALGGLDAVVVLPARQSSAIGLDVDAGTWADAWSLALTTEVLAAACATHIAARSFLARRKAGRIVLVTNGRDGSLSGAMPTSATRAALSRLGADLTRELGPHGIGVSVVTTGPGGTQDFAVAQVADVVEALLSTPVLSGVSSRIG